MELGRNDGVLDEELERNDLEGSFVRGFKDDGTGGSRLLDFQPSGSTDAPAIARLEAGKTELRHGSAEVIAESLRGFKKRSIDDAADGVDAVIVGGSLAAASAVEASHGFAAADVEGLAKHVPAAIFDGFNSGHRALPSFQYPTSCRACVFVGEDPREFSTGASTNNSKFAWKSIWPLQVMKWRGRL
jgi:hypothetical protein